MKKVYILLIILICVINLTASTIFVKYDAVGSNNGTSWTNAYVSLQSALDGSALDDEIWVAAGTYKPSYAYDLTNTSRYYHFRLKTGVKVYGGFVGNESLLTERDVNSNITILSGDLNGDDASNFANRLDNCYHVFYHPTGYSLDLTALLDGFTIISGYANGNSTPTTDLTARGGGIYNYGGSPTINNCIFKDNYAYYGGGIYNYGALPYISNCTLTSNKAQTWGGGIYNTAYSSPTIINCLIVNNNAVTTGGGVYNYSPGSNPTITNCTIANNSAVNCGGIRNYQVNATVNNCIIWGNTSSTNPQQILITGGTGGTITLNNCCLPSGSTSYDGTPTFNNCINSDPGFVNTSGGDFSICGISPCADAGNDLYISESYDIRGFGFARKLNKNSEAAGTVDIGAYEYKLNIDPLPVEVISFSVNSKNDNVILVWQTATEKNNYGFEIERKAATNNWNKIVFIEGSGNSNSPKQYAFTDKELANGTYNYRLKQIDNDGNFTYSNKVEVIVNVLPEEYSLSQNFPNPFNPSTNIEYALPAAGNVKLTIFNTIGQIIKVYEEGYKGAGLYNIYFNASELPSGIYFYKLEAGRFTQMRKMILMK